MSALLTKFRQHGKQDTIAGFIVFLVALPLCIGISVASGVPATAGIITAIIGGVLGSIITGSYVTINGPAAGLIVIALACVEELGQGDPLRGYHALLACTVAAGCLQILLGLLRAGSLGLAFPSTVVHGMLSAIGIIIISKQAHILLGVMPQAGNPVGLLLELPRSIINANVEVAIIGLAVLAVMILFTYRASNRSWPMRYIPAPLAAVLFGIGLGMWIDLEHEHVVKTVVGTFTLGPKFLLNVPQNFLAAVAFPDFSHAATWPYLKHTLMITFVASTESILSTCAIERLDPLKRKSNLDRELLGKGACNALAGLVGGLPMIAEIVRSSANISNGAKTQFANFMHGCFLLLFLTLVPQYLHLVPLAALAAILISVGYQLAKPAHFFHAAKRGRSQAVVFLVTVTSILFTDLLVGVIIGALCEFAFVAFKGKTLGLFRLRSTANETANSVTLHLNGPVAFTNYLPLKVQIDRHSHKKTLTIDLTRTRVIDHTVLEHLKYHIAEFAGNGKDLQVLLPATVSVKQLM